MYKLIISYFKSFFKLGRKNIKANGGGADDETRGILACCHQIALLKKSIDINPNSENNETKKNLIVFWENRIQQELLNLGEITLQHPLLSL